MSDCQAMFSVGGWGVYCQLSGLHVQHAAFPKGEHRSGARPPDPLQPAQADIRWWVVTENGSAPQPGDTVLFGDVTDYGRDR